MSTHEKLPTIRKIGDTTACVFGQRRIRPCIRDGMIELFEVATPDEQPIGCAGVTLIFTTRDSVAAFRRWLDVLEERMDEASHWGLAG
jgi:hypothetical protein